MSIARAEVLRESTGRACGVHPDAPAEGGVQDRVIQGCIFPSVLYCSGPCHLIIQFGKRESKEPRSRV